MACRQQGQRVGLWQEHRLRRRHPQALFLYRCVPPPPPRLFHLALYHSDGSHTAHESNANAKSQTCPRPFKFYNCGLAYSRSFPLDLRVILIRIRLGLTVSRFIDAHHCLLVLIHRAAAAVAAKGFASLLDLASHGMVSLKQPAPYGAISISISADSFNQDVVAV